ncbi:hypothetical protein ACA097_19640 [Pseudomonas sp. QL9]|uniref:hypothetical protein n=1 Tax=Pseudomonas sp. QL9 TaxID=3242725 RepID=UPI00352AD76F
MKKTSAITIADLDEALASVGNYTTGKISLKELEEAVSIEAADLLTRLGLAILKISHMHPASFRPQFIEPPTITTVGQSRLSRLIQTKSSAS